jgi:hypothetical protein
MTIPFIVPLVDINLSVAAFCNPNLHHYEFERRMLMMIAGTAYFTLLNFKGGFSE